MDAERNGYQFVIRLTPTNEYKGFYYFSIKEGMFVGLSAATRFKDAMTAIAYANEFGIKLGPDKQVVNLEGY